MPNPSLPLQTREHLLAAKKELPKTNVLVGLDGFVDTIIHVVAKRESSVKYQRMSSMAEFGKKIHAAAGQSANFEYVRQMVKLGGNGPIMANALNSFGAAVTYLGNLGKPNLHPVFEDFAKRTRVISIAEPGYTDAVEFEDGKLMFGKHESLREVNWKTILAHVPEKQLIKIFADSSLVALVNWTMLPFMTAIFRKLLTEVAPKLPAKRNYIFFDLADPAKRTSEDILEAMRTIAKFEKRFRVILGLNFNESRQVGQVLGIKPPTETHARVAEHAANIRQKLKIDTVVIHPTAFAAAADATGTCFVPGAFTPKPKITTGAGDHFNAGFCLGRILKGDLAMSLQTGVATSGYYVRNAKSPTLDDLARFLRTL